MRHTPGYGSYSSGCRCDGCKQAKADYMRTRRAGARAAAQKVAPRPRSNRYRPTDPYPVVEGITHGRYGFEERGCRCLECREARAAGAHPRKRYGEAS